jgi:hypothetical protein
LIWGNIKEQIRATAHRSDISDELLQQWQLMVNPRMTRAMDLKESKQTIGGLLVSSNPYLLPEAVEEILEITAEIDGYTRKMRNVSREELAKWKEAQGQPFLYTMKGQALEFAPYAGSFLITLHYRARNININDDASENFAMADAPGAYIWAMLHETFKYFRDIEMANMARQEYLAEMDAISTRDRWTQAGDNPEMNGASTWV